MVHKLQKNFSLAFKLCDLKEFTGLIQTILTFVLLNNLTSSGRLGFHFELYS